MPRKQVAKIDESDKIEVIFNPQTSMASFSDIMQIEMTPDHAILNFLQRIPSSDGITKAQVVSRIALSWVQFSRAVKLMDQNLKTSHQKIVDSFNANIGGTQAGK